MINSTWLTVCQTFSFFLPRVWIELYFSLSIVLALYLSFMFWEYYMIFLCMPFLKFCGNFSADRAQGLCMIKTNDSYWKLSLMFHVKCSWQRRRECSRGTERRARADADAETPQNLPVAPNTSHAEPEKLCPLREVNVLCMMKTFWSTTDRIIHNQITIYTGQHDSIFQI